MEISRRQFIQTGALASATALLPGFLSAVDRKDTTQGPILLLLTLSGGNDSLNTVIPFRNEAYYKARPDLGIRSQRVLKLNDELGLHPALSGFRKLYDEGLLGFFNQAGYPSTEYSHSRASRVWETASAHLHTGWIGRFLDLYPQEIAIEADSRHNLALKGKSRRGQLLSEATCLLANSKRHSSHPVYPEGCFGQKLKNIASLITSGCTAGVYHLSLEGFDTHVQQKEQHDHLLYQLGNGLHALATDLKKKGLFQKVLVLVYSEFGREIAQNHTGGTEHGKGGTVFLISGSLKKQGLLNIAANRGPLDLHANALPCTLDFREIYATLLNRWFHADDQSVLKNAYPLLDFI